MDREEALDRFRSVFDIISDCLEQAEELCRDHGNPVNIHAVAQEDKLGAGPGKTWTAPIKLNVYTKQE